jgi:hypothetical protein|tara:strand:+ start:293 stop:517 length:225 start_codon:yes stop_codon:yes gene_type:complete
MKVNLSDILDLNQDYGDSVIIDINDLDPEERMLFIEKLYSDLEVFKERKQNIYTETVIKNYKTLISGLIKNYAH